VESVFEKTSGNLENGVVVELQSSQPLPSPKVKTKAKCREWCRSKNFRKTSGNLENGSFRFRVERQTASLTHLPSASSLSIKNQATHGN